MKIRVLFDKEGITDKISVGQGVSFLIGDNILFDTGEKFEDIQRNAEIMGVDLSKIKKIVISHQHEGHIGGLWGFLNDNKDVTVYICADSGVEFKEKLAASGANVVQVKNMTGIDEEVYSTGESLVMYEGKGLVEQGLIINFEDRIVLIFGCCHPGILNVVHKAGGALGKKIDYMIGGFHLIDKEQRFMKYIVNEMAVLIKRVAPLHCTGPDAGNLLKEIYKDNFLSLKAGMEIEI
ncbi:MAG: MBL fold metallo-hydrolase [Candidatus Omnitrophica bacterium]|nr:MBL fold metallo-hydrolase [Candidatus Omnitrophota bacterium]